MSASQIEAGRAGMAPIDHFNLRSFDLNLLVAFDALMLEGSVTKAAARLRVQQPAVSHQLSALRLLFEDELFVRIGNVMHPTAKAQVLAASVRQVLVQAQATILTHQTFDPQTSVRTFQLGFSCEELLILPALAASLKATAPGIKIMARRVFSGEMGRELDEGGIDLAIGCYPPAPVRYHHRSLFEQHLACCYNDTLLDLPDGLRIKDYLGARHVFVSQQDDLQGCIGSMLTGAGYRLDIVMSVPEYLTALAAAVNAPLVVTLPYQIADRYAAAFDLAVAPLPVELPLPPVSMIWSEIREHEIGIKWLRTQIARQCGSSRAMQLSAQASTA
jgi:LysR family transcriptional activator of mexEF-oprN operon